MTFRLRGVDGSGAFAREVRRCSVNLVVALRNISQSASRFSVVRRHPRDSSSVLGLAPTNIGAINVSAPLGSL